jgi:alpha-L-arabinofuranosidase
LPEVWPPKNIDPTDTAPMPVPYLKSPPKVIPIDVGRQLLAQEPAAPRIVMDAGKTGSPISPYIYGQFIEHLGRCIYGGIWAEMLEDRKFFHAVGTKQSPWKIVGPAGSVSMNDRQAFVGEHSPRIVLAGKGVACGIAQTALALRAGKPYVGRIWLAGSPTAGPVAIRLAWGDGPEQRQTVTVDKLTTAYAKTSLQFLASADTDQGRLEIAAGGEGEFSVGTVSLMPADNVQGMRPDTLALLKDLDAPVYRWPGGNFVSGYQWKDGIGDCDRRPPRKNPAWKGIEHNDFGFDEFMTFCRILKTEPYVAVNSGQGDIQGAVEEVQYANASADTPGGRLRVQNGRPEPYGVKWWSIGNEMYGNWQLGHMPLEKYEQKHNEFAKAMRAVDSHVQRIAVGSVGAWSEGMLRYCNDSMDLISEHFYCVEKANDLPGHIRQISENIRRIANAHREYRKQIESLKGKDIRIAMDEWNYWYGPDIYGQLGTRYFLKDALGIAAGLHEYARQSDMILMANYAQTVNVIGCIKTTKTAAAMDTTALPLMLYRKHFGTIPVSVETSGPVDAAAAWTADRKALTIGIVNPTLRKLDIPWRVTGARLGDVGQRWQIIGPDPMAHNEPGKKPAVVIEASTVEGIHDSLSVAPCSVTLFVLKVQ